MKVTVGSIDGEAVEAFKKMLKEMGVEEQYGNRISK